jgi:integrase
MKLTDHTARTETLPAGKDDLLRTDEKLSCFGLRVRRSDKGEITKTWHFVYRDAAGKMRKPKLGDVDAMKAAVARDIATDMFADLRRGIYPHEQRQKAKDEASETFGALTAQYLAARKPDLRTRTFIEVKRHFEKRWDTFDKESIHQIDQRRINKRHGEIVAKHGKFEADRAVISLSTFFAWAMKAGIVTKNPASLINRAVPKGKSSRDRWLTDAEIAEVWAACRDDNYGRIVKILLLTGQRREEVGAMSWDELDLKAGLWTLPRERVKNDRAHTVPLLPTAISIFEEQTRRARRPGKRDLVFSAGTNGFGGWSLAKIALDERIAEARKQAGVETPMPPWRLHDLRRTVISGLARLGVNLAVTEKVVNHVSGSFAGVVGVYQHHDFASEKRDALERWDRHVAASVNGRAGEVVPFRNNRIPG